MNGTRRRIPAIYGLQEAAKDFSLPPISLDLLVESPGIVTVTIEGKSIKVRTDQLADVLLEYESDPKLRG